MIIDMRTYTYHPDTYRPFLKFYREQGYAITSKHLGYNLGLFTASSGVVNRTVQWFAYDSHDHRDACRKGYLTSGTKIDFTNDADKMIRQQESRVLIPTEFSPLRTIDPNHPLLTDPACERRMFEFNTYECRPGQLSAALELVEKGAAYPCFCTKEQLEADRKAAQERKDPFQGYQRRCRDLDPEEACRRIEAGEPYVLRIKVPEDRGDVVIHDAVHGEVTFDAKELDDFVIFRSDGTPTYNFATVVDDAMMKITHVIRGDDHLSNTPRQVMVYEALGAPVPTFAHISMILGADGKKLSKRHGATSVEEYRDAGYLPDAFVNYLALLGWSLDGETTIIPRDVLASKFSLDRISKNPATFDPKKLDWVNAEYINGMSDAQFADEIMVPELHEAGLIEGNVEYGEDWIDALAAIVKPRTKMPADAVTVAAPIFATAETLEYDEKSVNKGLAKEGMGTILDAAKAALEGVDDWTAANIDAALEPLPEQMDLKKRVVFQAVRVAVCGNMVSPPLGETMALVGRDDCLARIDRARTMAL